MIHHLTFWETAAFFKLWGYFAVKVELAEEGEDYQEIIDRSVDPPEVKVHIDPDWSDGYQVLSFPDEDSHHHEGQEVVIVL